MDVSSGERHEQTAAILDKSSKQLRLLDNGNLCNS